MRLRSDLHLDTEELVNEVVRALLAKLRRELTDLKETILASLDDLRSAANSISEDTAALAALVPQLLDRLDQLGVNDAEVAAIAQQLSGSASSLDSATTKLADGIAGPVEEPPPDEQPPAEEVPAEG